MSVVGDLRYHVLTADAALAESAGSGFGGTGGDGGSGLVIVRCRIA